MRMSIDMIRGAGSPERPIGWWLKEVDRLLERAFERALAAEDATRRQWQVLNVLAGGASDVPAVAAALAPFWTGDTGPGEAEVVLAELAARGWVRVDGRDVALMSEGAAARERMMVAVREQRTRAVEGVSEQDYRTVVATLQRMAANLA